MRSWRFTSAAIALFAVFASGARAQVPDAPQDSQAPLFRVQVWGDRVADFEARVWAYVVLREELARGLPALAPTDRPEEIRQAVRALAKRIRVARAANREGDIFTPAISDVFKRALLDEVRPGTCAAIMDDNPGELQARINRRYPEGKPLSTVPPQVLAALPALPDDLQYRFAGRHLILLDTRASVVLDRIPSAIGCEDSPRSASAR
jgi:hypothetical protein